MSKVEYVAIGLCALAAIAAIVMVLSPDDPKAPSNSGTTTSGSSDKKPTDGRSPLDVMREAIKEVAARAEHDAGEVKVTHILVAFKGAERSTATRSKDEAEKLAAKLYADIKAGADFAKLAKEYSDDSGGGTYTMTTGQATPGSGKFSRATMAGAFGNTGWRLKAGEVGVAEYDQKNSPFGWHIIKRLE